MQALRLVNTKDLPHDEWLDWRRKGLGGSDIAAICGMSRYQSPMGVFLDKTGKLPPLEDNPKMKAGRMLEQVIADWFAEETGYKVMKQNAIFQHKDHPHMLANIDRWLPGENAGLECKNTSEYCRKDWFDGEEEIIPTEYQLQANHYMSVLGADRWFVAVLIGGWDFQWRVIYRNETIIQSLYTIEHDFWHHHVLANIPPAVTAVDTDNLNWLYPESKPESYMHFSESYYDLLKSLLDTKGALQRAKLAHEDVKNKVKAIMGETEVAYWQGEKFCTWKSDVNGKRRFNITGGL